MKIKLWSNRGKIVFNRSESRRRNSINYWIQSDWNLSLLDLRDDSLEKIISYLNMNASAALNNTCKRTQKAVEIHLSNSVMHVYRESFFPLINGPCVRQIIVKDDLSLIGGKLLKLLSDAVIYSILTILQDISSTISINLKF